MKLIVKETYYLLSIYFTIFVLVGVSFYYVTKHVISEDFNEKLYGRKEFVLKQLHESDSLLQYQNFSEHTIDIKVLNHPILPYESISDTIIYHKDLHQYLTYRQIGFSAKIHDRYYKIYVRRLMI
ncbi:MAG: sensor histidine kinase [Chitinophagaceae bacterium]|nr:sensor histidine kinase [Chitinophagaceae bacterium]